jgi:hypothetical protein
MRESVQQLQVSCPTVSPFTNPTYNIRSLQYFSITHKFVLQFCRKFVVFAVDTSIGGHVGLLQNAIRRILWLLSLLRYSPSSHQEWCHVTFLHAPVAFHQPTRCDQNTTGDLSGCKSLFTAVLGRNDVCHTKLDSALSLRGKEREQKNQTGEGYLATKNHHKNHPSLTFAPRD